MVAFSLGLAAALTLPVFYQSFSLGLAALSVPVSHHSVVEDFLFVLGKTRDVQHIEEFPGYECRRVQHGLIEGCEDLWLDHEDRKLYAACGDVESRRIWCPALAVPI